MDTCPLRPSFQLWLISQIICPELNSSKSNGMHIYSFFLNISSSTTEQLSISLSVLKKEHLLYINILFHTASLKWPVMHSDFQDLCSSLRCESSVRRKALSHFARKEIRNKEKRRQERKSRTLVLI